VLGRQFSAPARPSPATGRPGHGLYWPWAGISNDFSGHTSHGLCCHGPTLPLSDLAADWTCSRLNMGWRDLEMACHGLAQPRAVPAMVFAGHVLGWPFSAPVRPWYSLSMVLSGHGLSRPWPVLVMGLPGHVHALPWAGPAIGCLNPMLNRSLVDGPWAGPAKVWHVRGQYLSWDGPGIGWSLYGPAGHGVSRIWAVPTWTCPHWSGLVMVWNCQVLALPWAVPAICCLPMVWPGLSLARPWVGPVLG
jgi:hypothetical protein